MRLSEAMMLGSTTCKMVPGDWDSCALGCAGNAIGLPSMRKTGMRIHHIVEAWPWLQRNRSGGIIADKFDNQVCRGLMTLEQLVDWVRFVEPKCGDCNRYECTCAAPSVRVLDYIEVTA